MTVSEFDCVVKNQLTKTYNLLCAKGDEYAEDTDRLSAFRAAAELQNTSMEVALGGMLAKHIVSIYQMLPEAPLYTSEKWDEKINDAINYLLLLKACIIDEEIEYEKHSNQNIKSRVC